MYSFFKTLVAGLAIVSPLVNGLPQAATDGRAIQEIEQRAPHAAPITKHIGAHTGLYVPMMYAAYMDASSGNFERYQCDMTSKGPEKETGTLHGDYKKMLTDSLASCVSITIVTRHGALKTHIPPYLCPAIKKESDDKDIKKQLKYLKKALNSLYKKHGHDLQENPTMLVVSGAFSHESEVRTIIDKLFDNELQPLMRKLEVPHEYLGAERSTVIDLTTQPATFYVEGVPTAYH
ncbi:hypothetical protein F4779DRAFT_616520 [Xylariaceae sp. FL0662B]|nr:hypothetical protein F4779DRAFT_616520 [Xylariaceae sp. FL0662B]